MIDRSSIELDMAARRRDHVEANAAMLNQMIRDTEARRAEARKRRRLLWSTMALSLAAVAATVLIPVVWR